MTLLLTVLCIFGGFVLQWRRASLTGYFGSRANVPGIFTYRLGNLFVWALGISAYWGAGLLLLVSDWRWAAVAAFLGFALRVPVFRWVCGPPRSVQNIRGPLPQSESHYKVAYKKHIRWSGRMPIPDNSCDFVAPSGTVIHDLVTITFPQPFGEYGQEERFYSTLNDEEFEHACKNSSVVFGYCRVEADSWQKAGAQR